MLGVNAIARQTGLPRSTVSERMRKGHTADQIRIYAAMREGRTLQKAKVPEAPVQAPAKNRRAAGLKEYEVIMRGRERLEAIHDAKLRRAKALAEGQELENMARRDELIPTACLRKWSSRFLIEGRNELLKGPIELADSVAAEHDPLKITDLLRGWIEATLQKFDRLELWVAPPSTK